MVKFIGFLSWLVFVVVSCLFCVVLVLGEFMYFCEDDIVCKCIIEENKVFYFNVFVYLENKE